MELTRRFNLNREAAPLATQVGDLLSTCAQCFNLNREAAPLADRGRRGLERAGAGRGRGHDEHPGVASGGFRAR